MRIRPAIVLIIATCWQCTKVEAQRESLEFQPRSGNTTAAQQQESVSQDLLDIYQKTKSATSQASVTAIARACSKVIPDRRRSKVDRRYAASLLAWALNRRGEIRSDQASKLVDSGQVAEAEKLDRKAADDFETAIEYGPSNWRTHHNLAISLAMNGDYRRAISEFTHAIRLKPGYANAHFNRGELHFERGNYTEAITDYTQAVSLDGNDPQYYNSRGHCRFMLESYDDAIADYRKAAELGSDSAVYQTDLADAYQFRGNWELAANAYRAAVAANNKYPRAYQNAAWLMATCPDPRIRNQHLALAAAKKAIEFGDQRTSRSLDTLAAATAAAGKIKEAVRLQSEAIDLAVDDEDREELTQRLRLYQRGNVYRQPQSNSVAQAKPDSHKFHIRTASNSERRKP